MGQWIDEVHSTCRFRLYPCARISVERPNCVVALCSPPNRTRPEQLNRIRPGVKVPRVTWLYEHPKLEVGNLSDTCHRVGNPGQRQLPWLMLDDCLQASTPSHTIGHLLPLVISPNRRLGRPQHSVTCHWAESHYSAIAAVGLSHLFGR